VSEALRLLEERSVDEAEAVITRGIELGADDGRSFLVRGLIRARRGDQAGGIEDFDRAAERGEESAELYRARGISHYLSGDNRAAEADLSAAVERAPADADGYLYRGLARALLGHYEQALADLQAAEDRHTVARFQGALPLAAAQLDLAILALHPDLSAHHLHELA